jgi:hypothetical protein
VDVHIHPTGEDDQTCGIQHPSAIVRQILAYRPDYIALDENIPLQGSASFCDQPIFDQNLIQGFPFLS